MDACQWVWLQLHSQEITSTWGLITQENRLLFPNQILVHFDLSWSCQVFNVFLKFENMLDKKKWVVFLWGDLFKRKSVLTPALNSWHNSGRVPQITSSQLALWDRLLIPILLDYKEFPRFSFHKTLSHGPHGALWGHLSILPGVLSTAACSA